MDRRNAGFGAVLLAMLGVLAVSNSRSPQPLSLTPPPSEQRGQTAAQAVGSAPSPQDHTAWQVLNKFLGCYPRNEACSAQSELGRPFKAQFLVAMLPEPVAPPLRYGFDSDLEAIERAAGQAGYVLDRFDLPWPGAAKTGFVLRQPIELTLGSESGEASSKEEEEEPFKSEPGVILFRGIKTAEADARDRLLFVLLVGETPTGGAHKPALYNAFDQVAFLSGWANEDDLPDYLRDLASDGSCQIHVVGPSFSGSAESLGLAIHGWLDKTRLNGCRPSFKIISGSATAVPHEWIEDIAASGGSFKATVVREFEAMEYAIDYLEQKSGAKTNQIAILSEASTLFGGKVSASRDYNHPGLLTLSFPLHISELRSSTPQAGVPGPAAGLAIGRKNLPLPAEESKEARYIVSPLSPRAPAYADLVMDDLLTTIHRENIRFVGIAATDVEDLVFLAQKIEQNCPDTVVFTTTADLLYLHTDVNESLRGMLVFSTYPLFSMNQLWTYPFAGSRSRLQFPTANAEGAYNATLAQLDRPDLLLEYGQPFELKPTKPGLWLTVVGRDQLWPVAFRPVADSIGYLLDPSRPPSIGNQPAIPLGRGLIPRSFLIAFVLLAVICGFGCAFLLRTIWQPAWLSWLIGDEAADDPGARRSYLLAITMIAATLFLVVCCLALLPYLGGALGMSHPAVDWTPYSWVGWTLITFAAAAIPAVLITILVAWIRLWPARPRVGALLAACVAVLGLGIAYAVALQAWTNGGPRWAYTPASSIFLFLRSANLFSGVSALLPIIYVGAAGAVLLVGEARRMNLIRMLGVGFLDFPPAATSFAGVPDLERVVTLRFSDGLLGLLGALILFATSTAFLLAVTMPRAGRSVDGRVFDGLILVASMFIYSFIAMALLRLVVAWRSLKRLTLRLYDHPTRSAYGKFLKTVPRERLVDLAETSQSITAIEYCLQQARSILAAAGSPKAPPDLTQLSTGLRKSIDVAETNVSVFHDAEVQALTVQAAQARRNADDAISEILRMLSEVFESRSRLRAGARPIDNPLEDRWELFLAGRVVGMLRATLPQLTNLAFSAAGAILLMLLALSSYPFAQRESLVWFSWSFVLPGVGAMLYVFASINRDRIVSVLSGTTPGRLDLTRDFMTRALLFGLIPVLGLLGVQFPGTLGQIASSVGKLFGGQ